MKRLGVLTLALATAAVGTASFAQTTGGLPAGDIRLDLAKWPKAPTGAPAATRAAIERRVAAILAKMSVEEKVGQLLQPEILNVTPEEVKQYHLGSVLNGGNGRPDKDTRATAAQWLKMADAFYDASVDKSGGRAGIPIIWGIDSVHGNNSVFGGTIFPHNIGLGAANDPKLMVEIGRVTAVESSAIGTDWTFAPALSVPQDDRWGRTYEGFSERPEIAGTLGAALTEGLQGNAASPKSFFKPGSILATAKHFIADGNTQNGRDQGDAVVSEQWLRDTAWAPYVPTLKAGAQTVMASYSKWNGVRMHGHGPLMTEMLKNHAGFDGFVVGDFNGHALIPGCTNGNCPQALNAGVDMYMIPVDWKELYENLVKQVNDGTISKARLDDAVTRILRVKMRAGLFEAGKPSARPFAGQKFVGTPEHREVARRAARESLVLLKDNAKLLPFPTSSKVLVAGMSADSIPNLVGGWSMNWQGSGLTNADFPTGTSVYKGLADKLKAGGGSATLSRDGSFTTKPDVAVVVFGETPYAEYQGDRESVIYKVPAEDNDLRTMKKLKAAGIPVIGVFLSGRPLWINPQINASDAMIAAFLPGTEGGTGIADMLVAGKGGKPAYDFKGKLSFSWPKTAGQTALNLGMSGYDPLFAYGYGLTLATRKPVGQLSEDPGLSAELLAAASNAALFQDGRALAPWRIYLGDPKESRLKTEGDRFVKSPTGAITFESADRNRQEDTKIAQWFGTGEASMFVLGYAAADFAARATNDEAVTVSMAVLDKPSAKVEAALGTVRKNGAVDVTALLNQATPGQFEEFSFPLRCFAKGGADFARVDMPLMLRTSGTLKLQLASMRLGAARGRTLSC